MRARIRLIHRLIPKTCASKSAQVSVLFLLSILFYTSEGFAADFTGQVVGVIDSDSIRVMHNGKADQVRLNGSTVREEATLRHTSQAVVIPKKRSGRKSP